jgi:hydrogenase maturation protease
LFVRSNDKDTLVLALGNDILGDDAVGIHAACALRKYFGETVDIVEAAIGGFALLDFIEGYERVLLLDAVATGHASPGTVMELAREDFGPADSTSPHHVGLPEVFALANRLSIPLPREFRIVVMEISPPTMLSQSLRPEVQRALPAFVERAVAVLAEWGIVAHHISDV